MARDSDKGAFERDFGYLMPFFDRVEAAASDLSSPGAADELRRLIAGEKARWTRIRDLLAGSTGQGATVRPPPQPTPTAPNLPTGFTIGPLKQR
jgi:hypothetical protein